MGIAAALLLASSAPTARQQSSNAVLAAARQALGGEAKLAAVRSIAATGETRRARPDGTTGANAFELFIEWPDKYMKRAVVMAMGPTSIYRQTGFNGTGLIDEMDTPPALASGGDVVMVLRRVGDDADGQPPSAEQVAAEKQRMLLDFKREFSRLTLGMLATGSPAYPLTVTSAGQAEAPDGKADVLDMSGEGGFAARLFVDATTHLPLMVSWADKEPLEIIVEDDGLDGARGGGRGGPVGENVQIFRGEGPGPGRGGRGGPDPLMAARIKEAEARRRTVEYRLAFTDYKSFDGIRMPSRLVRTVDGRTTEEIVFDRIRINSRIDPKKFQPSK